jgi:hypothetical protein
LSQVSKTLEYRRARFNTPGRNLEQLTRQTWGQFATHVDRAVNGSNHSTVAGMRGRDGGAFGFFLHGARFNDGQGVGTIPMFPAPEVDLGERQPNAGENFVNSDFLALIRDNHVICLNCGRNGGSLRGYLSALFKKAGLPVDAHQFDMVRVGNPKNLAVIKTVGVKSIDLKVSIAEATADEIIDGPAGAGMWKNAVKKIGDAFRGLTERDAELRQLRDAEQGSVTVSINVDKRDVTSALHGLDHLASEFMEDEEADGYIIHLRNDTKITPHEITVRKPVKLDAHANSVSVFQAWEAMQKFMGELAENGQLEA